MTLDNINRNKMAPGGRAPQLSAADGVWLVGCPFTHSGLHIGWLAAFLHMVGSTQAGWLSFYMW
uniref:Uncharacterized protein n=1 Tax=Arundo donax TaxID=35708 RepID=A0A0A9CD15_ARUDO